MNALEKYAAKRKLIKELNKKAFDGRSALWRRNWDGLSAKERKVAAAKFNKAKREGLTSAGDTVKTWYRATNMIKRTPPRYLIERTPTP